MVNSFYYILLYPIVVPFPHANFQIAKPIPPAIAIDPITINVIIHQPSPPLCPIKISSKPSAYNANLTYQFQHHSWKEIYSLYN